ncbi:mycoredoxin [Pilimelia anulata]|nr:mycoredoxin [Pilimelia anulata]
MLTMYSTAWCGYCKRLKAQLDRANIAHRVVDIEHDPAAEAFVMSANGGNATVPTVAFPDGTVLTNPTITQVTAQLAA